MEFCNNQDVGHPASNILLDDVSKVWRTKNVLAPGAHAEVMICFDDPKQIVDIAVGKNELPRASVEFFSFLILKGNAGAAIIEVLVGTTGMKPEKFEVRCACMFFLRARLSLCNLANLAAVADALAPALVQTSESGHQFLRVIYACMCAL